MYFSAIYSFIVVRTLSLQQGLQFKPVLKERLIFLYACGFAIFVCHMLIKDLMLNFGYIQYDIAYIHVTCLCSWLQELKTDSFKIKHASSTISKWEICYGDM